MALLVKKKGKDQGSIGWWKGPHFRRGQEEAHIANYDYYIRLFHYIPFRENNIASFPFFSLDALQFLQGQIYFHIPQIISSEKILEKLSMGNSFKEFQDLNQLSSVSLLLHPHEPRQQRAFWADSEPFIDKGRLLVIHGNYREPGSSQRQSHFYLTTTGWLVVSTDDETARVNEGRRVSSKSPSLARAGKEEGARKLTRLASSFPDGGKSILAGKKTWGKSFGHHGRIFTPEFLYTQ